jgi:hypothetical protein
VVLGHAGLENGTLRLENISEPKVYLYTSHGTNAQHNSGVAIAIFCLVDVKDTNI